MKEQTPVATIGEVPPQGLYDPAHEHDACGVGFVVDIKGRKSHAIVRQGLLVLINLLHRGACGCEPNTGDGAGILLQVPDRFLRKQCGRLGIPLPGPKDYGVGCVFLPRNAVQREKVQCVMASVVSEEGQRLLGWRDVPTDDRLLGASAVHVEPHIKQVFIGRGEARDPAHFERKLYVIRKRIEHAVEAMDFSEKRLTYIPSLSSNTLIYKGMLSADQIETMYPDLRDPDIESALALVHQRFSTNTFPSWPLAHPYRYVAHNGEINTLRGNINWMRAREALFRSDVLGDDLAKVLPVTREGLSDSATFDNVLEFLVMNGRSLPHAILMMIPEPWQHDESMSPERRAFYDYHSSLMEPCDGPASPLAVPRDPRGPSSDSLKRFSAQVPNPPLDQIREELVTAMESTVGPEGNLLKAEPASCRQIVLKDPVLSNEDLAKLAHVSELGFKAITLPMLYPLAAGAAGLERAIEALQQRASRAVAEGHNIVILSDRGVSRALAAIPSLLATAAVHHHLVRHGERTRCGLVVETGDAREVHHMCLLIGYGAGAVNPWVAFETLDDLIQEGVLAGLDRTKAVKNYIKALNKGILKVMAKMGISTLQSYCGAQIFEAIGLNRAVVDRYFTGTASRVGGIGIDVIAEEVRQRHAAAYPERPVEKPELDWGGEYQWRRDGEHHQVNPDMIAKLQASTRAGSYAAFKEYSKIVDDQSRHRATLRGLFTLKPAGPSVPLDEVESVESILKRFATGAMSYGSISQEAHETLAIAMNRIGGRSNTGEGGEDPARYVRDPNGDWRRSAVKQVASGRFGVTSEYLVNATDLQIKMAQGAKPGEGGQLPGHKVYPWIAKVRYAMPGVGLISPPPHHDIYSIEDLAQLIHDLKSANPSARIHVKLVAEVGVGTVAAGVAKAHADVVLISGHDGGTGASPLTSIKHGGVPWELGLAETQQVLVLNKLRDRIVVQTDGQMKSGRDVVMAALLGAEEYGFSTAPLVVLGCIMMRVCHLNTCPDGVATQDPEVRKRFAGRPEHVVNFFRFVAQEVRELMASLGFRSMSEMIGRADCLDVTAAVDHWKARGLDLSAILYSPAMPPEVARRCVVAQDHGLEKSLDHTTLIPACREAIERGARVELALPIRNVHRTVGTTLGYEVTLRHGAAGLPEDTIRVHFTGSAGQSFGAFVPRGITFTLEGDANDYWGKGLSGGRLIVFPPRQSTFVPEENIVIGNVALYGATSGEAYVRGVAGERFCVRNSGAHAVVEGIGDHGCEYMTGGRVVVLGRTGRNFAAGMSGGIAFVLDVDGDFKRRCNLGMVDLEPLDRAEDIELVRDLIRRHIASTGSTYARKILDDWIGLQPRFVKVMPKDYRRILLAEARARAEGREPTFAELVGATSG